MRRPVAVCGLALLAFGLGLLVHATATVGYVVGGLGLALLIGSRFAKSEPSAPATDAGRPPLAGLGTRVEQILRLADQQATERVVEAQRKADKIIADAEAKASDLD
jgi:membrane-bound ClpP family serine protease